jgi:adenosylmethionine-8-amino-7-oxononanoate aminotransferase
MQIEDILCPTQAYITDRSIAVCENVLNWFVMAQDGSVAVQFLLRWIFNYVVCKDILLEQTILYTKGKYHGMKKLFT